MCDRQMKFHCVAITGKQNFLVYCLAVNLNLLLSLIISVQFYNVTTFKSPILELDPIAVSKYETYSHDPVSFVNFSFSRLSLL